MSTLEQLVQAEIDKLPPEQREAERAMLVRTNPDNIRRALRALYDAAIACEPDHPEGIDESDYRDAIRSAAQALGEAVPQWVEDAWALDDTDPRLATSIEATCVGCGCTDTHACEGGCAWAFVDRDKRAGICDRCDTDANRRRLNERTST